MSKNVFLAFAILGCVAMLSSAANAADLSHQEPIIVAVELGTKDGKLKFTPDKLSFEAGKLYKLVIRNRSPVKHYFSSLRFAAAAWSRKVETKGAELKGSVREIELKPGGDAAWFFVPVQAGVFHLECTVPGHADLGMVGEITVN